MWKTIFTLSLAAVLLAAAPAVSVAQEAELIAVLKSDAPQKDKADACRELTKVATKESVPVLAGLLTDEKLAHMARNTLEQIPDPAADAALRDAMGKVQGRLLMGVIGSLGVRRDAAAVDAIAKLLGDPDAALARAAARALGEIATTKAARALDAALAGAPAANQVDFCEGLFRCAETLEAEGQGAAALAIYERLRGLPNAAHQIRAAALRGVILAKPKEGVALLLDAIRGADYVLTTAAARIAMELPAADVTAALAGELPKLPADKQILIVNTLGYRGDDAAGPALLALAAQADPAVRLAAVRNVTHLGYVQALPVLAELSLNAEGELATVARDCLANFPGRDADATIAAMLSNPDVKVRSLAVEMIGQRNAAGTAASLVKAAADADEAVRLAALKALRDQAGLAELPALLNSLVKARSAAELQAAENALAALCARQSEPASGNIVIVKAEYGDLPAGALADVTEKVTELVKAGAMTIEASNGNFGDPANGTVKRLRVDYTVNGVTVSKTVREQELLTLTAMATPPAVVDAICTALDAAPLEAKLALLRTLRTAGGAKALQTVQAAAAASDEQVKDTALRVVCEWPTTDALPMVADLVKSPPSKTIKVLALRGFVRLVPQQDASEASKLESLKDAMTQAERNEEKRLVLSALGTVPSAGSLAVVVAHLENPVLKEEACLAAVAIAEKIASSHRAEVAAAMSQVSQLTANEKLAARAKALAGQAKQ